MTGQELAQHPGFLSGARSIIVADVYQVSTACGWGVPLMNYTQDREDLARWHDKMEAAGNCRHSQAVQGNPMPGSTRQYQAIPGSAVQCKECCIIASHLHLIQSWGNSQLCQVLKSRLKMLCSRFLQTKGCMLHAMSVSCHFCVAV
jgi:hypothetical protein